MGMKPRKTGKRIMSLVLTVILILSLLPEAAMESHAKTDLLMDDFDAAVLPGIFFAYGRTAVGGTVVDQKDLKIITGRM